MVGRRCQFFRCLNAPLRSRQFAHKCSPLYPGSIRTLGSIWRAEPRCGADLNLPANYEGKSVTEIRFDPAAQPLAPADLQRALSISTRTTLHLEDIRAAIKLDTSRRSTLRPALRAGTDDVSFTGFSRLATVSRDYATPGFSDEENLETRQSSMDQRRFDGLPQSAALLCQIAWAAIRTEETFFAGLFARLGESVQRDAGSSTNWIRRSIWESHAYSRRLANLLRRPGRCRSNPHRLLIVAAE